MPASMMSPAAGPSFRVSGSTRAMAAAGPRPGRTPTVVPTTAPARHASTLAGWSPATTAVTKPVNRGPPLPPLPTDRGKGGCRTASPSRASGEEARGQGDAQPGDEDRVGDDGDAEGEGRQPEPVPRAQEPARDEHERERRGQEANGAGGGGEADEHDHRCGNPDGGALVGRSGRGGAGP